VNRPFPGALARLAPLLLNTAGKQRLSILIYHRVVAAPDPMRPGEPTAGEFDWQMRLLREHFHPLPLLEAAQRLHSGDLPERAVCVTFDDGYADNEQYAMPVLRRHGVPATVFVSTGFLNGGRMFNDTVIETVRACADEILDLRGEGLDAYAVGTPEQRLRAVERLLADIKRREPGERSALVERLGGAAPAPLPDDLMMTDEQVRNLLRNGVDVGAHTVHHPILTSVTDDVAREEIAASKACLEDLLQGEVGAFAYPNGKPGEDYAARHRDMVVAAGFRAAVSTHWGVGTRDSDCFQLPRFTPWDRSPLRFGLRLLYNYRNPDSLPGAA